MKHRLAAATLALFMLIVSGAGVATAAGPNGHPGRTPSFSAHCPPADAGGAIHVQAKVLHAARGTTFTAAAAATFASPSASVNLRRAGKSFVAVGKIAVPADQPAGPVTVTVTITYAGAPTVLTCTSKISPPDTTP